MKEIELQEILNVGTAVDVMEIRKRYALTEDALDQAIFRARNKGFHIVKNNGIIKRIQDKKQYERALFEELLERSGMKAEGIEYRGQKK